LLHSIGWRDTFEHKLGNDVFRHTNVFTMNDNGR
jgi:hypothetical protein